MGTSRKGCFPKGCNFVASAARWWLHVGCCEWRIGRKRRQRKGQWPAKVKFSGLGRKAGGWRAWAGAEPPPGTRQHFGEGVCVVPPPPVLPTLFPVLPSCARAWGECRPFPSPAPLSLSASGLFRALRMLHSNVGCRGTRLICLLQEPSAGLAVAVPAARGAAAPHGRPSRRAQVAGQLCSRSGSLQERGPSRSGLFLEGGFGLPKP